MHWCCGSSKQLPSPQLRAGRAPWTDVLGVRNQRSQCLRIARLVSNAVNRQLTQGDKRVISKRHVDERALHHVKPQLAIAQLSSTTRSVAEVEAPVSSSFGVATPLQACCSLVQAARAARSWKGRCSSLSLTPVSLLVPIAVSAPGELSFANLANLLWALATLGIKPQGRSALSCLAAISDKLAAASPRDMVDVICALAQMALPLDPAWLDDYCIAAAGKAHTYQPRHLARTLWALAKLSHCPPAYASSKILAAVLLCLPSFTPRDIANTLWACATLGLAMPPHTLADVTAAAWQLLPRGNSQDLANCVWGAARLGSPAPPAALAELVLSRLQQFTGQGLFNVLWGLAVLQSQPGNQWLQQSAEEVQSRMGTMRPQELTGSAWALAVLGLQPCSSFLASLQAAALHMLPRLSMQDHAVLLTAMARLNAHLEEAWLTAVMTAMQSQLAHCSPRTVAVVAWGLAKLGAVPSVEWGGAFFAATTQHMALLQPQGLASLLWSCARLRLSPGANWLLRYKSAALTQLPAMSSQDVSVILTAAARLSRQDASSTAMSALAMPCQGGQAGEGPGSGQPCTASQGPCDCAVVAAAAVTSGGGDGCRAEPAWLLSFVDHLLQLARRDTCSPQAVANSLWALGSLGLHPGQPRLHQLTRLMTQQAGVMRPIEVVMGARGMVAMDREAARSLVAAWGCHVAGLGASADAMAGWLHLLAILRCRLSAVEVADLGEMVSGSTDTAQSPRTAAVIVWSMGRLTMPAPTAWLASVVRLLLPGCDARQLAMITWGLARTRQDLPSSCLHSLLAACYHKLPSCSATDLSMLLWGLARMDASPPNPWMAAAMAVMQQQLPFCSPRELAALAWALAHLAYLPGRAWMGSFWAAVQTCAADAGSRELSIILQSTAHLAVWPPAEAEVAVRASLTRQLPRGCPAELLGVLRWIAVGVVPLREAWLKPLMQQVRRTLESFSPAQLVEGAVLLAQMRCRPTHWWLVRYTQRLQSVRDQLPVKSLQAARHALWNMGMPTPPSWRTLTRKVAATGAKAGTAATGTAARQDTATARRRDTDMHDMVTGRQPDAATAPGEDPGASLPLLKASVAVPAEPGSGMPQPGLAGSTAGVVAGQHGTGRTTSDGARRRKELALIRPALLQRERRLHLYGCAEPSSSRAPAVKATSRRRAVIAPTSTPSPGTMVTHSVSARPLRRTLFVAAPAGSLDSDAGNDTRSGASSDTAARDQGPACATQPQLQNSSAVALLQRPTWGVARPRPARGNTPAHDTAVPAGRAADGGDMPTGEPVVDEDDAYHAPPQAMDVPPHQLKRPHSAKQMAAQGPALQHLQGAYSEHLEAGAGIPLG